MGQEAVMKTFILLCIYSLLGLSLSVVLVAFTNVYAYASPYVAV